MAKAKQEWEVDEAGLLTEKSASTTYSTLLGSTKNLHDKSMGIARMYQKLCFHFRQRPTPIHLVTYPESLLSLSDAVLVLAFERAQANEQFLPLPGKLREYVRDEQEREYEHEWAELWLVFLRGLGRHGIDWKTAEGPERREEQPDGRMIYLPPEPIAAPELPPELLAAFENQFGSVREAMRWVRDNHPRFIGEDWTYRETPRAAADKIEMRIRESWEREKKHRRAFPSAKP